MFLLPPVQIGKIGHYFANQEYEKNVPSMIAAAIEVNKSTHVVYLLPTLESHYHILWVMPASTQPGKVKAVMDAVSEMVNEV